MRSLSCAPQGRAGSSPGASEEPETCRAEWRLHPENPQLARIRHITLIVIAALALVALMAPVASAALNNNFHDAIRDCNDDGVLQDHYTRHALKQAHDRLPASLREYSDCSDVLAAALARTARGGSAGGDTATPQGDPSLTTGSGAIAPDSGTLDNLKQRTRKSTDDRAAGKVKIAGRDVTPGTGGLWNTASHTSANDLPGSLMLALIALGAMGVLAGVLLLRYRWPETRHAALRILRR
jgi:hypothetical protein